MVAVASDIWWQTFIRLGFTSGLRVGEMLNLTWPDIDEPNGQVIVSAKRAGRFQVGDEDYPILPWSCKSHRERRVPLHPDAAALLAKLRMKAGASRYVFLSLQRLRRIESSTDVTREIPANGLGNNMLRTFKTIQGEARALPVGTMHDLRKSYGTHMSHRVTMPELRQLMGHASITTTADFYLDVSTDMSEKVRAVFASA